MADVGIPSRGRARGRDRHGRGMRGPIVPFTVPAWRTRSDKFDDVVALELMTYRSLLGEALKHIDYGVLDVPEVDPAPWEEGVPLARYLPFERPARITGRIVFYRMPILAAAARSDFPRLVIHDIVTEQLAAAIGRDAEDIDYLN
ncbi:metallopeptidase family protein [Changpingibacter yushuensis]|uniref:metallopeptidase family protein n=1 Tax=Changpingibacter yushuensis TaxID=2758440 RepID=UPI0015F38092|nr:metallopeptidase family protein [Changpingibacter yushuensis]